MKTNFRKFLALVLATLMVVSAFGTMATAIDESECTHQKLDGSSAWEKVTEVDATCVDQGYTLYECSVCRKVEAREFEDYTEHEFVETIVKAPGCAHRTKDEDKYGLKVITCDVDGCNYYKEVTLDPIAFIPLTQENIDSGAWKETWILIQDPNVACGQYGDTYYQCQNVGTNPGGICGWTSDHVIEIKQHDYKPADVAHKLPTCQEYGLITYTCQNDNCPEKEIDVKIAKLECEKDGHWSELTDKYVAPNCVTNESHTYYCSNCDIEWTVVGDKAPDAHVWDEGTITTAPDCDDAGVKTFTCTLGCGATYTEAVDALGHTPVTDEAVAPDCENTGLTEGSHCDVCGATIVAQEEIPAKGHTEEIVEGYDATCTEDGLTDGVKCSVCGETLKEQEVIPATGHSHEAVVTDPTCTEDGYTTHTCPDCGDSYKDTPVPATGHDWGEWENVSGGTCVDQSLWRKTCSAGCIEEERRDYGTHPANYRTNVEEFSKNTEDDDINDATNSTYVNNECWVRYDCTLCRQNGIEEKIAHNPNHVVAGIVVEDATCEKPGRYADHCLDCGNWTFYAMPVEDHEQIVVVDDAVAPTCTETGLTEGSHCGNCGLPIVVQEVIPALGHNKGFFQIVVPATCTEDAVVVMKCTRDNCTHEWSREDIEAYVDSLPSFITIVIYAIGHDYESVVTDPTCTEDGYTTHTCKNCGNSYEDTVITAPGHTAGAAATCTTNQVCTICGEELVPSLGHTPVTDEAVDPDCINTGLTEGSHCDVCGEVLVAQEVVPALGHAPNIPEATCTTDKVCTVCGELLEAAGEDKHPKDHSYWVITKEPTCTTSGVATGFCDMCDKKDLVLTWDMDLSEYMEERLAPTGHGPFHIPILPPVIDGLEFKTPTCTEAGSWWMMCQKCGEWLDATNTYYPGRWDALGHEALEDCTYFMEPATCVADGVETWTCDRCDEIVKTNVLPADGVSHPDHALGFHRLSVDVNGDRAVESGLKGYARTPSCAASGLLWYYCEACAAADTTGSYNGFTVTETDVVWDCHDDLTKLTLVKTDAPTCTEDGLSYYECNHPHYIVFENPDKKGEYITETRYCPYTTTDVIPALGHDEYTVPGYDATCTEDGLTDGVACDRCEETITAQETIPATGHNMSDWERVEGAPCTAVDSWFRVCLNGCDTTEFKKGVHNYKVVVVVAPDCENGGYTEYRCGELDADGKVIDGCGHIYNGSITEAHGHDYEPVVTAPTCTDPGYTTYTCKNNPEHTYVGAHTLPTGHHHELTDYVAPSCTSAGSATYTCSCGDTYTDVIPATGHVWTTTVIAPDCDDEGYTLYTCEQCVGTDEDPTIENPYKGNFVPALGHDYELVDSQESTCLVPGYETYVCSRCDDTYTDVLKLAPHVPFEWNENYICREHDHFRAPTCTEEGIGYGSYCMNGFYDGNKHCAGFYGEPGSEDVERQDLLHHTIPVLEHNEVGGYREPTCTTAGFTYYICQYCGNGHGLDLEDGTLGYIVDENGDYVEGLITDYVHPIGHQPDGGQKPTCTEPGYTGDKCKECGCELSDITVLEPTNHPKLDWHNPNKKEDKCPDCGEMINVHGEYFVEDLTKREVWEVLDDDYCRYTIYTIEYCTKDDCGYNNINILYMENVPHAFELVEHVDATVSADGYDTFKCKYCGHKIPKTNNRIENTVEFTFEVGTIDKDGNFVAGGKVVNGGKAAIQVDMAAFDVAMSQLMLTMKIDTNVLTFDENTSSALNANNGFQNAYWAFDNGVVRAMTSKLEGSEDFIITNESGQNYLTLVFDVATDAYTKTDKFVSTVIDSFSAELTNTEIVASGVNPINFIYVEDEEIVVIYKNADVSGNGKLDLTDAHLALDVLSTNGYDVQADIDCDGEITYIDYMLMQMILLNEDVDDSAYVEFLNLYIAK